ncbi:MAG: PQQ-binding-like beta-propeller repeat protein [Planctomycetota bacterium]
MPRFACPRPAAHLLLLAPACLALAATTLAADDWPCFRGPRYDGISPEKGLRTDWDQVPPRVWERELGSGFSAFALVGGKAYTAGTQDKQQVLFCLDAATGATVWHVPIEKEFREGSGGDGPRGTPTVADGRAYIQGALGRLVCCDAATGEVIWSAQYSAKPKWGYSHSILVEGDLAITQAGGDEGAVVALNRRTGEKVWQAGGKAPVGYGTPYPFTMAGKRYIAVFLAKKLLIVHAQDGKEAATVPWETDWDVNAAAPIFHDGHLFVSSGYKTGSAVFKLEPAGDGLKADKVWGIDKVILGKFQSACLWEGKLYVADERALKCVDFLTGKLLWKEDGIRDQGASVLIADGHLLAFNGTGELYIGPLSPDQWAPTAQVELLTGKSWTVPILHDGKLYVRNLKTAACYNLKK